VSYFGAFADRNPVPMPGNESFAPMADAPASIAPALPGQMGPTTAPFVWGSGGRRMTPDEVEREKALAERLQIAGMDFSPVQSWTQGLARVADGIVGGLDRRRANKSADANAAESQAVVQALLAGGNPQDQQNTVLSALANPYIDDKTRALVGAQYSRLNAKPREGHFFEANNGDQGIIDPETGQVKIVYHDPTPKVNWVTSDNGDGTKTLVPVVNGQVMQGGGGPVSGAQAGQPPATLPPDFDFGGPTPQASGGFPR
jgi:hypothetical protein